MIPPEILDALMNRLGFDFAEANLSSSLYVDRSTSTEAIIIDNTLFEDFTPQFSYLEYTSWQNRLMHKFEKLYRFASDDVEEIKQQVIFFSGDNDLPDSLKMFGRDRQEQDIDPTRPEYVFESVFERVYGSFCLSALEREYEYFDLSGKQRFIDYMLKTKSRRIAVELNGESFHHPQIIGIKKYKSQLFKQNSLVKSGYPVFRWSLAGMSDEDRFADQMRSYFGSADEFENIPHFKAERHVSSFELKEHQEDALKTIAEKRANGESTFLIVLPTGTGKTEIFIEDHKQQHTKNKANRALVIVPSTELKNQTIKRFRERSPHLKVGEFLHSSELDVCVQTTAFLLRHYQKYDAKEFDYIVVDEAHHAPAQGLRRVLEHYQPNTLIGVTATDGRLDQQSLAEIFGRYEVHLTLSQAIERGLLPPIRAVRLETNINFSEVRFNGKEFVKADLQKTVLTPSRDSLIVDLLQKYFDSDCGALLNQKQGVIFCVDVKHAERLAALLNRHKISAAAVSGKNRKAIEDYKQGQIRFLCACELLNEGWDAPQTSILVMARPTLSKVLYMQQLGRGTRHAPGKEALYVIDVVDSYGAALQPWNLHSLLNLTTYRPFQDILKDNAEMTGELMILDQLWEGERKLVPLELFNYENEYGNLLNEEQLARELFISTGTVYSWLKKGEVQPDKTLPFGRKTLNYFKPEAIAEIRALKGLKVRTEETRLADFTEFLEKRDYTFSFKMVFLLAFFRICDKQGEAELSSVVALYAAFYKHLHSQHGRCEKENSPLNDLDNLNDLKYMSRNLLENPFEKFERKRFVHHCKELSKLSFDTVLWEKLDQSAIGNAINQMVEDLADYYQKHLHIVVNKTTLIETGLLDASEELLQEDQIVRIGDAPYIDLNYYPDIKIACGHFKQGSPTEVETIQLGSGYGRISAETHFLANASGNSMNGGKNPIEDGDLLLLEFITPVKAGSQHNKTVVIERNDHGVSEYLLRQVIKNDSNHYSLRAFNPDYEDMIADDRMVTRARLVKNLGKI